MKGDVPESDHTPQLLVVLTKRGRSPSHDPTIIQTQKKKKERHKNKEVGQKKNKEKT